MKKLLLSIALVLFAFATYANHYLILPSFFKLSEKSSYKAICQLYSNNTKNAEKVKDTPFVEAVKVRKQYICPILDSIWSKEIVCEKLDDDEIAFNLLKEIDSKVESPSQFIDYWNNDFLYNIKEYGRISPEIEKDIQMKTEGHITYSYPNSTTLNVLADINKKYPCSEASALALLKIGNILLQPEYLSYMEIEGKNMPAFRDEEKRLNNYIRNKYPNSWQGKIAQNRIILSSTDYSSEEKMRCLEEWIAFVESKNILENKYFVYNNPNNNIEREFANQTYSQLAIMYLNRCDELIDNAIKNGSRDIPKEAINMYNKHYDLMTSKKNNHPKYFKEMRKLPKCYSMIKKQSPKDYRGDPPLRLKK